MTRFDVELEGVCSGDLELDWNQEFWIIIR